MKLQIILVLSAVSWYFVLCHTRWTLTFFVVGALLVLFLDKFWPNRGNGGAA